MDLKWNLCLTSLSRRGPVNPSTPTFANINLTETMTNLIVPWKFSQKRTQESLFAPKSFNTTFKSHSYLMLLSRRGSVNPVNPHFSQYQSYKNNYKFTYCFKCHQNMVVINSITFHVTFQKDRYCFLIWRHLPVEAR